MFFRGISTLTRTVSEIKNRVELEGFIPEEQKSEF